MPKAKTKVPKTEKMWMVYDPNPGVGFVPSLFGVSKADAVDENKNPHDQDQYVRVRIVPEAEYQRLIAASKRKDKET